MNSQFSAAALLSILVLSGACVSGVFLSNPEGVIGRTSAQESNSTLEQASSPYMTIRTLTPNPEQQLAAQIAGTQTAVVQAQAAQTQAAENARQAEEARLARIAALTATPSAQAAMVEATRQAQAAASLEAQKYMQEKTRQAEKFALTLVVIFSAVVGCSIFLLAVGMAIRNALDARRRVEAATITRIEQEQRLAEGQTRKAAAAAAQIDAEARHAAAEQRRLELEARRLEAETSRIKAEVCRMDAETRRMAAEARLLQAQAEATREQQFVPVKVAQAAAVNLKGDGSNGKEFGNNGSSKEATIPGVNKDAEPARMPNQGKGPDNNHLPLAG